MYNPFKDKNKIMCKVCNWKILFYTLQLLFKITCISLVKNGRTRFAAFFDIKKSGINISKKSKNEMVRGKYFLLLVKRLKG